MSDIRIGIKKERLGLEPREAIGLQKRELYVIQGG